MNNIERKRFWDTLCSLEGLDIANEHSRLVSSMNIPQYIHRYRSADCRSIEALRTNTLFCSTANHYDDPRDTYIHIDIKKVENEIKLCFSNQNSFDNMLNGAIQAFLLTSGKKIVPKHLKNLTPKKVRSKLEAFKRRKNIDFISIFMDSLRDIRTSINNKTWSICFSQNSMNESLWLKYANNHKGFLITYDRLDSRNNLCGKEPYCATCPMLQTGVLIYPIYYSLEHYEPVNLPIFITLERFFKDYMHNTMFQELIKPYSNIFWEYLKVNLIKDISHEHDEEWRILIHCNVNQPRLRIIPAEVTLGYKISEDDKEKVISAAKEAGIQKIYQTFINDNSDFDKKLLQNTM